MRVQISPSACAILKEEKPHDFIKISAMRTQISIVQADITKLEVEAIVNAANESLLGGGGVDGAIHRAAGRELLEECKKLGGCPTGEAKITKGYKLPAKYVIHTVGPIWYWGKRGEAELLASCYFSSLNLAKDNKVKTIAFPAISCGIYGYPVEQACRIAIQSTLKFIQEQNVIEEVIFVCFGEQIYQAYLETAKEFGI